MSYCPNLPLPDSSPTPQQTVKLNRIWEIRLGNHNSFKINTKWDTKCDLTFYMANWTCLVTNNSAYINICKQICLTFNFVVSTVCSETSDNVQWVFVKYLHVTARGIWHFWITLLSCDVWHDSFNKLKLYFSSCSTITYFNIYGFICMYATEELL